MKTTPVSLNENGAAEVEELSKFEFSAAVSIPGVCFSVRGGRYGYLETVCSCCITPTLWPHHKQLEWFIELFHWNAGIWHTPAWIMARASSRRSALRESHWLVASKYFMAWMAGDIFTMVCSAQPVGSLIKLFTPSRFRQLSTDSPITPPGTEHTHTFCTCIFSLSICVYQALCLSRFIRRLVLIHVCLSVCLCNYLCLPVFLSLSIFQSIYLSYLSVSLSVYPFLCLTVFISRSTFLSL